MDDGTLLVLVGLVMAVGLVGVVVPLLPGTSLILAAGAAWAVWVADDGSARWVVLGAMSALFVVGAVLKYALPGRRMRGELPRRTLVLAGVGGLVGFVLLPPLGLVLGLVAGVYLGEAQRLGPGADARRSSWRVLQAIGLGLLAELVAAVLMVGTWLAGLLVA